MKRLPFRTVLLIGACWASLAMGRCAADKNSTATDARSDADAGPTLCRSATVTLSQDEGVVFGTCEVLPKGEAHDQKCDLMAYRHSDGLDLKAGVIPHSTTRLLLHRFAPGGVAQTFDSLADVPAVQPSAEDNGAQSILVADHVGFTVEHNVTTAGYSRVWVESMMMGTAPTVTLRYEILAP